jgi:hypothetical protein
MSHSCVREASDSIFAHEIGVYCNVWCTDFCICVNFLLIVVYFAHELGLQLVAETSRAVFVSVTHRNKNHMQRGKAHLSFHHVREPLACAEWTVFQLRDLGRKANTIDGLGNGCRDTR